jgi:capsular exopolysaccharide synthesis family protein
VITSPGPNEGKSSVAVNLGLAIAETGRKVLLIDMDLRRPQLHLSLQRENTPGLADTDLDLIPLDATALSGLIQPVDVPNLAMVAAGAISTKKIPGFLHHPQLAVLLAQLRGQADFVLIDTPPLGAFPDARTVARFCDGVIMVLRAGQTTKSDAIEARTQLEIDGTAVIGTILNDAAATGRLARYKKYYQSLPS